MAPYKTSSPLLSLPSAANGVVVTPPGVANGWSSWVELTASAATAMRLTSIIALPGTRAVNNFYEVEIGVGAAGFETTVAAVRGYSGSQVGAAADADDAILLGLPADVIALHDRVSVRLRQASTATDPWSVAIQYWALPMAGVVQASTIGPVSVPAGSVLSMTTGAANVYGAWTEVTASADGEWTITNVVGHGPNNSLWDVEIGIGSAGSEVPFWTVRSYGRWFFTQNGWEGGPWNIALRPPIGPIAAGSRVVIRGRSSTGVTTLKIGLSVLKESVAGAASQLPLSWTDWTVVTAPGGPGNFSPWVTLLALTSTDITVSGVAKTYPQGGTTGANYIQLAIGPEGSEVLFAECFVLNAIWGGGRFNFPLPYARLIPAGSRVALRYAHAYSASSSTTFSLSYQEVATAPDFDNYTSALIQQVYLKSPPVNSTFAVFAGSPAWANGNWVEIDASVPVNRVITAYTQNTPSQTEVELDIGVGPAGSEVVATTVRWASGASTSDGPSMYAVLPVPTVVGVGSRLAVRARASRASAALNMAFHYTVEPVSQPSVDGLAHDCDTGIFTVTGQNLTSDNATLTSVTRDAVPVGFTVLTQTEGTITFHLTNAFVDGTYCVVVTSDFGPTDPLCAAFACANPSCEVANDFGTTLVGTSEGCRVSNTFGAQ